MKNTSGPFSFAASALLALSIWSLASLVAPVPAQAQQGSGEVPIKIVGYWGGTTAEDPSVMGTITLADEHGKNQRSFGVTQVQSFDPPNAMMDVFQPSKLKPAIIVYGRASETSVLFGAKDKEKVTVLGIYWANRGNLIVSSVKPVAETN